MNRRCLRTILTACALTILTGCAPAVAPGLSAPVRPATLSPSDAPPLAIPVVQPSPAIGDAVPRYRPPQQRTRGPARLLSSRTRSVGEAALAIAVIAPDHTGLTTQSQPTLYWFASQPVSGRVAVTIQDEKGIEPLVERHLSLSDAVGMIPVRLAELGVQLQPGNEYRWSVAVDADSPRQSRGVVTSGSIRQADSSDTIRAHLSSLPPERAAFVLAEQGLWYDALAQLGELIERAPADPRWRRYRAALLEQVGLTSAAQFDRRDLR